MVEKVFHDFVKGLCFYYERRDPREEALDLWFQQVKHIPDESVDWISGQIRGRHESYPRNLPLVMRELWQQWLEDHPHRRAQGNAGADCPDCDETGLISIYRKGIAGLDSDLPEGPQLRARFQKRPERLDPSPGNQAARTRHLKEYSFRKRGGGKGSGGVLKAVERARPDPKWVSRRRVLRIKTFCEG